MGLGSGIRDPGSGVRNKPIPDPGSGSAALSASASYRACRSSSGARSWTPARTACTGSTWGSPAHRPALKHRNFQVNFTKAGRLRHNYGVGIFNTFLCSQSTQSGNGHFLATFNHSGKLAPPPPLQHVEGGGGAGGARPPFSL
jgi:hypothetical protein